MVDVAAGRTKRLMVFIPPRHGKSELVSRYFPAWYLGLFPDKRIILASYEADFAATWGRKARNLLEEFGPSLFSVQVSAESSAASRWDLEGHEGGMVTAGVRGPITGKGANVAIIDDPVKNDQEAMSQTYRDATWDWYRATFSTRIQEDGAIILVMTRWHCLLPGSDIMTDMGLVNIEAITSRHNVLTSKGMQPVLATASRPYRGDVIAIRPFGYPHPLRVTPEHRILTDAGWKEARDLRPGDWLVFPIPQGETAIEELRALIPPPPKTASRATTRLTGAKQVISRDELKKLLDEGMTYQQIAERYGRKSRTFAYEYAKLYGLTPPAGNVLCGDPVTDPEFWRIVGYWLAEGSVTYGRKSSPNVVRWTLGYSEGETVEFITGVLARYGIRVRYNQVRNHGRHCLSREWSSFNVSCSSAQLAQFPRLFGEGAHNKRLPEWAVHLPRPFAEQLVRGYVEGDGYVSDDGWVRVTSVSLGMLTGFQRLLLRLGVTAAIVAGVDGRYELRFPAAQAPWLTDQEHRPIVQRSMRIVGDRFLVRVRSVEIEEYEGPVYDIQTPAGDFVAHGMTVHNCDDLAGRLLRAQEEGGDKWEVVRLPALAEENDPLGRAPGEALCPALFTRETLERTKIRVGSYWWNALYQQRPSPDEGGMLKRSWWKFYRQAPAAFDEIIQSWDMAFKETSTSDYVVGQVWGRKGADKYLLDQVRDRMDFPATIQAVKSLSAKWPQARAKLVEDKANGPAVIATLKREIPGLIPVEPQGSKEARVAAVSPDIEAGNVYLPDPSIAPWVQEFIEECAAFPKGAHDDQCFVAGTKIATIWGDKSIEHIRAGDMVITPFGLRRVLNAGCTGMRRVIEARGLRGTPNHPVFTYQNGFVRMDSLTQALDSDILSLGGLIKWRYRKLLSSMVCNTALWVGRESIILASQQPIAGGNVLRDFMLQFGSFIVNKQFRRGMWFITKMAILLTTTIATWSVYRGANIARNILSKICLGSWRIWNVFARKLKVGIRAKKDGNGIENIGAIALVQWNPGRILANIAARNINQVDHGQGFAPITATSNGVIAISLRQLLESALFAGTHLNQSKHNDIQKDARLVAEVAKLNLQRSTDVARRRIEKVYNITVDKDHVYYAHGLLVSNCDAMSQALIRLANKAWFPPISRA